MGKLHRKVIRVLRKHFGPVRDALEEVEENGGVTGIIISAAFNRMDFDERQRRLSKVLQESLTPQEEAIVGPIAALTPAEADVKAMF
jgi:Ni,Fe-hydrogenase maturation factor